MPTSAVSESDKMIRNIKKKYHHSDRSAFDIPPPKRSPHRQLLDPHTGARINWRGNLMFALELKKEKKEKKKGIK